MTTRTRALVQRKGRKQHFATLGPGDDTWIALCDRDVPVFGATITARDDWNTWIATAQQDSDAMCSRCRTPLLLAGLALHELHNVRASIANVIALRDENRTLRAELSRWTTAALTETKRHATFVRTHITFKKAAHA